MHKFSRQFVFLLYSFLCNWLVSLFIFVFGRFGLFKTLFLIYPTDRDECLDFCPDIPWLRKYFSGRPTPAGLIMDGWRPMGIYFLVPDTALELVRKKNRPVVDKIMGRMLWYKKLSGAQAIGLAGQLGPVFEKHLKHPLDHPFYTSTYGNVFSIQSAVNYLVKSSNRKPWQVSLAIIGGGELGSQLEESISSEGYQVETINMRYTRKGNVKLIDEELVNSQLKEVDFAINLLPRGIDFIDCQMHQRIPESATVIDFSRPPIRPESILQNVVMGNRVQKKGLHFFVKLPGGWKRNELPACSLPSLVASVSSLKFSNLEEFNLATRQLSYFTALADTPATSEKPGVITRPETVRV